MFAVVPDSLIEWASPYHLALYCKIYLLEFRKRKYNLRQLASESELSYKQARKLQSIARETLKEAKKNRQ